MHRPLSIVVAASIVAAAALGGTAAADAATPTPGTTAAPTAAPAAGAASLAQAAADARANASASLGGITLPSGTSTQLHTTAAASASSKPMVLPLHDTIPVQVAGKRYDIRVTGAGPKSDTTRIRLFLGSRSEQILVPAQVRITVTRHGSRTSTLATTTTFRRFVVMLTDLQSTPLLGKQKHFSTRAGLVAALAHGLAIGGSEVTREYGAVLRLAQMSLDLVATLSNAFQYLGKHPSTTDFSAVATTHTTAGNGGYQGSVTLSGTPDAFSATATNGTDDSSLTEAFDSHSISISYTVHGTTTTVLDGTTTAATD